MLSRVQPGLRSLSVPQSTTPTVDEVMPSTPHSINDDVLGVICAMLDKDELEQIVLVDKRLREISLPLLFRRVRFSFEYCEDVWKSATEDVEDMLASTVFNTVVGHTRSLDIRILNNKNEYTMPPILPSRLAEFLSAPFRQLRTLVLSIDETEAQFFDDEFGKAGIDLPTVTSLMVGAYCDFMVPLCPNVEHVATFGRVWLCSNRGRTSREHSFKLIAAVSGAKKLQHFEMYEKWSVGLLQAVYDAMPSIGTLTLDGARVIDSLLALIPILSQFKRLKTLGLVSASLLDVGFDFPRIANARTRPGGREMLKRRREQVDAANKWIANTVFLACANLDVLVLDNIDKATVTRGQGRRIQDIQWCVEEQQKIAEVYYLY
ncbi:uncharacterized protein EV420DRAFT_477857 [Desarmillaria tabescens]|uniref:F-box domain-containing protein n=1 Tax=Armillaria tabescens TaxID=1929756 RepID=A0AA39KD63_ARMTA|nr:uncharacterized protein EV420DRAFT_477857 [Desarmillaria tabescens]KAK0457785.1 hypothetical protein EV420DRAFT_477857 [Desarmillaria tabescens]